jgi:hypothetical protein
LWWLNVLFFWRNDSWKKKKGGGGGGSCSPIKEVLMTVKSNPRCLSYEFRQMGVAQSLECYNKLRSYNTYVKKVKCYFSGYNMLFHGPQPYRMYLALLASGNLEILKYFSFSSSFPLHSIAACKRNSTSKSKFFYSPTDA